ncbi:MAG: Beta-lactamase class C-like and penicillin binding proteins (PBPs) superfamily, partial [uncultured Gemmatimonadaceae bacterium]
AAGAALPAPPRRRPPEAGDHRGAPARDARRARAHQLRELRRVGVEPRLGARRPPPAAGGRAGRADALQHREHAPPLGRAHPRHRDEHLRLRAHAPLRPARRGAASLADRPAGDLLRRQRDAAHPARDAALRPALPRRRPLPGAPGGAARLGGGQRAAAHPLPLERRGLRAGVVGEGERRPPRLLRLGLRRAVHLRRPRPAHRDGHHLGGQRPLARRLPPRRDPRHPRSVRRAGDGHLARV